MKKLILIALITTAAVCGMKCQNPAVVLSPKEGWQKIGELKAGFKVESEYVVVLGHDKFKAIKFKALKAPVQILSVQVTYESGKTDSIHVAADLQMNSESDVFRIEEKPLSKITLSYKTLPNAGDDKSELEVYGLK
jgi:hypothetical protein